MSFYFRKTPFWLQCIYPGATWKVEGSDRSIYLTFDDGPHPDSTPWILDQLDRLKAKATFFFLGKQVSLYPELVVQTLNAGHSIGNHTFSHLNGWESAYDKYMEDVDKCDLVLKGLGIETRLFRPPYGKMARSQFRKLCTEFEIILWNRMVGDFDPKTDYKTIRDISRGIDPGALIVLHENEKSIEKMKFALTTILEDHTSTYLFDKL